MVKVAELEIRLQRSEAKLEVEMTYTPPDSEAAQGPDRWSMLVDTEKLLAAISIEEYGRKLTEGLFFQQGAFEFFSRAREKAEAAGARLRVRLYITPSAADLHSLRWETLRDPERDRALCTDENIYFSRFLSSLHAQPIRLRSDHELRALVVIANPMDLERWQVGGHPLPAIDVVEEERRTRLALEGIPCTVLASAKQATLARMIDGLRVGNDLLYLVCHGAQIDGEPRLWLEDSAGNTALVSGRELVERVTDLSVDARPRLIVLASCQSAGTGTALLAEGDNALTALGPRLADAGIPAVIAMQGNITMAAVATFMQAFFRELRQHGEIDRAMAVARSEIRDSSDSWRPVLFMRLKSGRIWSTQGFAMSGGKGDWELWPVIVRNVRDGTCTPILGSGLLEPLMGSTRDIARSWAQKYRFPMEPHASEDLPQVAQYVAVHLRQSDMPHRELVEHLRTKLLRQYGELMKGAEPTLNKLLSLAGAAQRKQDAGEPYRVLADLFQPIYITTNADNMLADALAETGRSPQVVLFPWRDELDWPPLPDTIRPDRDHPLVYHLCGQFDLQGSLVVQEDDYFDYLIDATRNNSLHPKAVRSALVNSALLFLGFRLDDWDFRVLFRSIINREGQYLRRKRAHVAVQIEPGGVEPEGARRYLEQYFGDSDINIYWGTAEQFLRDLREKLETS